MPLGVYLYFFKGSSFTSSENAATYTYTVVAKKSPRESFKNKRKGNNNYFLHLKCEGMLHKGNYNLHLDSF